MSSDIGRRIAAMREARGISLSELAAKCGENKQTIYKYEKGLISNIPLPKIEAMASALGCSPEELVGWRLEGIDGPLPSHTDPSLSSEDQAAFDMFSRYVYPIHSDEVRLIRTFRELDIEEKQFLHYAMDILVRTKRELQRKLKAPDNEEEK